MNLSNSLSSISRILYSLRLRTRTLLPRQKCQAFAAHPDCQQSGIGPIFVINLDRQPDRLAEVRRELDRITDPAGSTLSNRIVRFSAFDARRGAHDVPGNRDIRPFYTLGDQLFVEPQPSAIPDEFDLTRPIAMSGPEVAVARSHIGIWKLIAQSDAPYALVLEDDVWFERGFGHLMDDAWREMQAADGDNPAFDVLYLSYKEVRHGAPKSLLSKNVFRPERGLWYMSGYVLSKRGAQALLGLLPCCGPVDLWINHKFQSLDVRALRRSVIRQRLDLKSTNSYSILPTLSKIGVLDGGDSLFQQRPIHSPVFAFGAESSGLSSLAMALSMLGYRCCSDLDHIPSSELDSLLAGRTKRVFDAYVNIDSLKPHAQALAKRYPRAKFVVLNGGSATDRKERDDLDLPVDADVLRLRGAEDSSWLSLCEHLKLAPPGAPYPKVRDLGQRKHRPLPEGRPLALLTRHLRHDRSPWVVETRVGWAGISASERQRPDSVRPRVVFDDSLTEIDSTRWTVRNDTFPGNLALFRPANVSVTPGGGVALTVSEESLGVRELSAAAVSSRSTFLFGRFEATLQATNVPGLVTGFFLHRDSPRQEIDVEIAGNRPDRLLVNVFYNPGADGAKYDYGYRGTPTSIELGFDASKSFHRFAIEWDACEIRWFVDGQLVHRRASWDPTPIPHLPMTLHVNTWPTRSRELAGRIAFRALPASAFVRRISVDSYSADIQPRVARSPDAYS